MNIDLLFTQDGEAGLIASENLVKKAAGLVLDTQNGVMTLEFVDADHMDLNIPVEPEFFGMLDVAGRVHLGAIKNGTIAQAYQIPLQFLDDPYRGDAYNRMAEHKNPLAAFNAFVKRCASGQPVHRDDLGDETAMGCVLGDAIPASLQFAPHLARRHAQELGARRAPVAAPRIAGPGMGLGGSSGGGTYYKKPDDTDS
jgi:hypothetical protein